MKIIIAADIFPPDIGGPATYSKNLASELNMSGVKAQVICYGDNSENFKSDDGYEVFKVSRANSVLVRYFGYFSRLLKIGKDADLIYAQGPVSAGFPVMLFAKILRKKFIIKVVGDYAWEQARGRFGVQDGIDEFQNKKYSFKVELFRKIQNLVASQALRVITPSYYLKGIVSGWGVKEDNIKVIYNAVNFDYVNIIDKVKAQEKIGIKGKLVFSIARLVPWKGFEVLINIWPEILKEDKDLKLVIAGDGPEKENLENLIKERNLENKVYLIGRVEHKKLSDYFSASEMFVLNSGYEGLPHVLIEAMAHKVPIIASDKGGNVEVIRNGDNGLIAEYNNKEKWKEAILKLSADSNLQDKFIKKSLDDLDKFKYSTMISDTLEFLKDMIK